MVFFKKNMLNLSKITFTAVCFGKISSENEQTNWRKDRQTDSLERTEMVISYGSSSNGPKNYFGVYFTN